MKYIEHGNRESDYGWEIDHINSISNGGTDNSRNLQPQLDLFTEIDLPGKIRDRKIKIKAKENLAVGSVMHFDSLWKTCKTILKRYGKVSIN